MAGSGLPCVFCAIASGDSPAYVVYEDERTIAILDINPAAPGHTLVMPRVHAVDLFDIDVEDHAEVARTVHRVAGLLDRRLAPDGLSIFQANRPAGWQYVFHFHVHLVPRALGDELVPPWSPRPGSGEQLETVHRRLTDRGDQTGRDRADPGR